LEIIAISTRKTAFPTVVIPEAGNFQSYVEITAGWNLLVEIGIGLGIDLDKPERARKVGNIYQGG
jgi:glucosamine--fructose-6-phosphate aminotransferase (isomerizing)